MRPDLPGNSDMIPTVNWAIRSASRIAINPSLLSRVIKIVSKIICIAALQLLNFHQDSHFRSATVLSGTCSCKSWPINIREVGIRANGSDMIPAAGKMVTISRFILKISARIPPERIPMTMEIF